LAACEVMGNQECLEEWAAGAAGAAADPRSNGAYGALETWCLVDRTPEEQALFESVRSKIDPRTGGATPEQRWEWREAICGRVYRASSALTREVFGNPFRSHVIDPAWLRGNGGAMEKMARAIYGERYFEDLPLLADALEEAGCTDEAILSHLRGP